MANEKSEEKSKIVPLVIVLVIAAVAAIGVYTTVIQGADAPKTIPLD